MLRSKLLLILPMVVAVTVGQNDGIGYYGSSNVRDQSPQPIYGSRLIPLPPRLAPLNRPVVTAAPVKKVPGAPVTTTSAPAPVPNPDFSVPSFTEASEQAQSTASPQSPDTITSQSPVAVVTSTAAVQPEPTLIPVEELPKQILQPIPVSIPKQIPEPEPISEPKQILQPIPVSEPKQIPEPEPISEPKQILQPIPVSEPKQIPEPKPISEPKQILQLIPVSEPKQNLEPEPISEPKQILQPIPVAEPKQIPEPKPISEPKQNLQPIPVPEPKQIPEPKPISEPKQILQPVPVSEPKQILQPEPILEPKQILQPEPVLEPKKISLPEPIVEPQPPPKGEDVSHVPFPVPQPNDISVVETKPQPIPISLVAAAAPIAYPNGVALPPLLPKRKAVRQPAFGRHPISPTPPTIYYPTPTYPQTTVATQAPPVPVTEHQKPAVTRPTGILKSDFLCTEGNGYFSVANECDTYIECKQAKAMKYSCPDGLHFNPAAKHYEYPCAFPSEVKCVAGSEQQTAKSSNQCPNQYGFYPMNEPDCSKYIMCQGGIATVMNCPKGLAFNPQISNCDWPANVPQCNPDAFKDFTCPDPPVDDDGQVSDIIYKYRYQGQCKQYVACLLGHPRLLSCDPGLSFDEASQSCVDEDYVSDCAVPSIPDGP